MRESKHNFTTTMTWPKIVVTKIIKIRRSRHIQEIDFVVHAAYELLDLIKIMVRQVVDKLFCETHYKKINMTHCKEAPKERLHLVWIWKIYDSHKTLQIIDFYFPLFFCHHHHHRRHCQNFFLLSFSRALHLKCILLNAPPIIVIIIISTTSAVTEKMFFI